MHAGSEEGPDRGWQVAHDVFTAGSSTPMDCKLFDMDGERPPTLLSSSQSNHRMPPADQQIGSTVTIRRMPKGSRHTPFNFITPQTAITEVPYFVR